MFDSITFRELRNAQCAAVIDKNKIVMGFAELGMYAVDFDREVNLLHIIFPLSSRNSVLLY